MNEADPHVELAARLGYGQSKRLPEIFRRLATLEQARLVVDLPAPPDDLAERFKMPVARVKELLEDLFLKGLIFPRNFQTREGYRFGRSIEQLHDSTQAMTKLDGQLAPWLFEMWDEFVNEEWFPNLAREYAERAQPRSRVVPFYRAVQDNPGLLPCEDVREIFKASPLLAVVPCSCRRRTQHCDKTEADVCLQLYRSAEYSIARGSGRPLSYEETMAIIDQAEEDGLVHSFLNNTSLMAGTMCSCCDDW